MLMRSLMRAAAEPATFRKAKSVALISYALIVVAARSSQQSAAIPPVHQNPSACARRRSSFVARPPTRLASFEAPAAAAAGCPVASSAASLLLLHIHMAPPLTRSLAHSLTHSSERLSSTFLKSRRKERKRASVVSRSLAPIISRQECMDSCGMPRSTARMPVAADTMGPIVDPHGQS